MRNELLSLLSFTVGIAVYTCSQLHIHKKGKWIRKGFGFFGEDSYLRKYKNGHADKTKFQVMIPNNNWYYNTFKIKYREAFFLSSTILVFLTDFYHASQFLFFLFISLSVVPLLNWTYGIALWILAHAIHFLTYRLLQR